jgi:CBS domain containing-hemolysin-like protein
LNFSFGGIFDRLQKIPHPGDQILAGPYRLTVKDSTKRKIQSLIVRKLENTKIINPKKPA